MLADHTLLYDEACPMCQWYTGAFVKHGFLDGQGRTPFTQETLCNYGDVDVDRARHQIALVKRSTGEVQYGTAGLSYILGHRWPWLRPLLEAPWFQALLQPLYGLISYNRKVIALDRRPESEQSCLPDFHWGYRIAYLLLATAFTVLSVTTLSAYLVPLVPGASWTRELLTVLGMVGVQWGLTWQYATQRRMHYLGHMLTVSLIGSLLLWPLIWLAPWLATQGLGASFLAGLICGVVLLMTYLHSQRVKALRMPGWLTVTWFAYRGVALWVILLA